MAPGDAPSPPGDFLPAPQIQTERLALTPLHPADAEALFAYRSLPEVSRYRGWRPSHVQDAADFIDHVRAADFDTPAAWFQFAIRERASTTLAGDLGVHFVGDGRQVEIGVTIAPAFQRRGSAREALAAVIDCLFHGFHKHRIVASVDPRNAASIGLVRSLGMRQEALFLQSVPYEGGWTDDAVFAILATEWRRQQRPAGRP